MRAFRSPYLRAVSRATRTARAFSFVRQVLPRAIVLAAVLILLSLLLTRRLPVGGPAYILYWTYDTLFLPAKSYAFTRHYPFSLIWWGVIVTLSLLWLASQVSRLLSDRSAAQMAYLSWGRWFVAQRHLRRPIVGLSRRLRLDPRLLEALVTRERESAFQKLWGTAPGTSMSGARLATLSVLWADLQNLHHPTPILRLQTCTVLLDALTAVTLYREEDRRAAAYIGTGLQRTLQALLPAGADAPSPVVQLTTLESVMGAIVQLAAMQDSTRSNDGLRDSLRTMVEAHNAFLSRFTRELEEQLRPRRIRLRGASANQSWADLDAETAQGLGEAVAAFSLATAVAVADPVLALQSVDCRDTLTLLVDTMGDDAVPAVWCAYVAGLPRSQDYRAAEVCAALRAAGDRASWEIALATQAGPLRSSVFELIDLRVSLAEQAAGPISEGGK